MRSAGCCPSESIVSTWVNPSAAATVVMNTNNTSCAGAVYSKPEAMKLRCFACPTDSTVTPTGGVSLAAARACAMLADAPRCVVAFAK